MLTSLGRLQRSEIGDSFPEFAWHSTDSGTME